MMFRTIRHPSRSRWGCARRRGASAAPGYMALGEDPGTRIEGVQPGNSGLR